MGEFAVEHSIGPGVSRNVVHDTEKDELFTAQVEEKQAEKRSFTEAERAV
jgi:hypothetical protein